MPTSVAKIRHPLLILALVLLSSCVNLNRVATPLPPLPDLGALQCCWQKQERVILLNNGQEKQLLTVVALLPDSLNLVVLSDLGGSLVSIRYDRAGLHQFAAPPKWSNSVSHYLITAVFLHQLEATGWGALGSNWSITHTANRKSLSYNGVEQVVLDYNNLSPKQQRTVRVAGQSTVIELTTLSTDSL